MALELKKRSKIFLKNQRVDVEETSSTPDSFGITNLPDFFGEGKNTFKLKPGTGYLRSGTEIQIEVLDVNGNPIYWETSTYKDSDNSRLISIWIYDLPNNPKYNTPNGKAELIVVGTLRSGGTIRWSRKINVIKSRQSTSDIIFKTTPSFAVSSSVETFTNKLVSNNQLTKATTSSKVYYKKSTFGDTVSLEYDSLSNFNGEMVGGEVRLSNISTLYPILGGGQSQPTEFTSSVTEVVSPTILRINTPITASDNRSDGSIHTYEYSDGVVDVDIVYYSTGSDVGTQNQVAFANITLTNVNPIGGRVYQLRTSIKSDGLTNSDYSVIGETLVENTSSISYKVPIPTEQLNDPKTLRVQFVNEVGSVSTTELVKSGLVFRGGNVYIAGDQSLITGSFHIGNVIGSGIEMAGHSSGYLKSVGYDGFTSASLGKGPGGFLIWSGSGNLQIGADQYPGVGMEMVSEGGSSSFYFTTHDGGNLKVITDEFFIGTENTQFISGSNGNIEISSSFFHLNPKDDEAIIGGFVVTPTSISSSQNISGLGTPLAFKSNGEITGSSVLIRQFVSSTNTTYTLFDTDNGIVDARNVGRQVVSDDTEYIRANVDDGSSYVTVAKYPVTFLPNETKIGISLMGQTISNGDGTNAGNVKLYVAGANTGSAPTSNTYYDSFDSEIQLHQISIPALGASTTGSRTFSPEFGVGIYTLDIPESVQGRYCELRLKLSNNPATATGTSIRVKNISIITTREFGGDFSDGRQTYVPSKPST
jgi:hypothetical protein